ncbi:hypothetical protein IKF84_01905, partial [Candidatus Saccharibacteria bacterium]|nr:hypothetical protein [Candidatus Saccharibacteria bacterium]
MQINALGGENPGSSAYVDDFSPVLGGGYGNGVLANESTYGYWWGSTAYSGAARYRLDYNSSSLYTDSGLRRSSAYIRCVSEEKDVSDLTYMQDMTAKVAADTPEGMTASLTDRR